MDIAGVRCVPGFSPNKLITAAQQQQQQSLQHLQQQAVDVVGFPLLIKACAGGGGKGMRLVTAASEFAELLEACKREAAASFNDDSVLLERYISKPKHIEFQMFAAAPRAAAAAAQATTTAAAAGKKSAKTVAAAAATATDAVVDCVWLYERDCSVQRRNQKVLEEAPSCSGECTSSSCCFCFSCC